MHARITPITISTVTSKFKISKEEKEIILFSL
jgi:hypothetical protein